MANKIEEKKSTNDIVSSSNVIATNTKIAGDIVTEGNIRVEGQVEGSLFSKNKIIVGESAWITGNIHAVEAEVSGKIDGEIHCSEILYLKKTSLIKGDIFTRKLVIENGAEFNGNCTMSGMEKGRVSTLETNEKARKAIAG